MPCLAFDSLYVSEPTQCCLLRTWLVAYQVMVCFAVGLSCSLLLMVIDVFHASGVMSLSAACLHVNYNLQVPSRCLNEGTSFHISQVPTTLRASTKFTCFAFDCTY